MANDEAEYARRLNLPGATKRHVDGGRRSMTVVVSIRGVTIATKTLLYKRGKVVAEMYGCPSIDPHLLPDVKL